MKLIGLSGYAQTGKDSVAAFLTEQHGYERRAFADTLREALYRLNPWLTAQTETCTTRVRYAELIDARGYEGARRTPYCVEIRQLLQRLGTEVGRNMLGEDVWVEAAFRSLGSVKIWHADGSPAEPGKALTDAYVFTDVRFPNEARAIVDAGGEVWRVERPGFGPVNGHPSETALDDWPFDVRIVNDAGLDRLDYCVRYAMEHLHGRAS